MSRMIFCKKYQKEMEGLVTPPFPGPRGQDIFNNVSLKAWQEWQAHQVRLINEKAQLQLAREAGVSHQHEGGHVMACCPA